VASFSIPNFGDASGAPGRDLALSGQMQFDEDLAPALKLLDHTKDSHMSIDLGDSLVALQAKRNGLEVVHMVDPADSAKVVSMDLRRSSLDSLKDWVSWQMEVAKTKPKTK
jgi:hypothetical protein